MAGLVNKAIGLLALATAIVPPGPATASPPQKSSTLVVYGNDKCPDSTADEVVVCARRPESERYRIPKSLRDKQKLPGGLSWASRVDALDQETRFTRPNGCSVVGSFGQSGCFSQMIGQWLADRNQARSEAAAIP